MSTNANWQTIWNKPKAMRDDISTLQGLIYADGFDSLMGKVDEANWLAYTQEIAALLRMREGDSIFEIGCGSGAFLYAFYQKGHQVGGIDFSKSLLDIAASVMPEGRFACGEATAVDDVIRADHFISNRVFFYFPDLAYAERVLAFMIEHAEKGVAILDVPDLALREVCEAERRQAMPPGEYDKKYKATPHLYYDRQWFAEQAGKYGLNARICSQMEQFKNYDNAKFRFNVIIRKETDSMDDTPATSWHDIWSRRKTMADNVSIQQALIYADGYDSGVNSVREEDWLNYARTIEKQLGLSNGDSLFEVGCGSGAFLYSFYQKGYKVGGVDFSTSLVEIAKQVMPSGNFMVGDADTITCDVDADYFISNGVFMYFPNIEYATRVLDSMMKYAKKGVAVLDIADISFKKEREAMRRHSLPPGEYEEKYKYVQHLYYERKWFVNQAKKYGLKVELSNADKYFEGYGNAAFRFNAIIRKNCA